LATVEEGTGAGVCGIGSIDELSENVNTLIEAGLDISRKAAIIMETPAIEWRY
jgi:hypothetical protein